MLGNQQGKSLRRYVPDYVVYDLETTGTSCKRDKIVEIAAIKVIGGKATEEFSSLVNPECPIPYGASQVNGITDEMVAGEPVLRDVLPRFLEFVGDLPLVGHNIISFDMKFIYRECREVFKKIPDNDLVDTLPLARLCLPELAHHRLTDLAEHYHLSTVGAHRALKDCQMTMQVYEELGKALAGAMKQAKICPRCGGILELRNGRYGRFWGCSGYPSCRYTENA